MKTTIKGLEKYILKNNKEIIKIGELKTSEKKILDYGCGFKYLEKTLKEKFLIMILNKIILK